MKTHTLRMLSGLLASLLLLVNLPATAQQSACLNDSIDKVCLQLTAQPDAVVQASRLDGQTDTYAAYTARVTGITNPTSSRWVQTEFTLTPAVDIVSFSTTAGTCSASGAVLTCQFDKRLSSPEETVMLTAKAPLYSGSSTPSTLTNTVLLGWNGRTSTVSKSLSVSTAGGYTWVPPNTTVTLVTAPETANPADQTSSAHPLFAKMVIPGRSTGFVAYLALNPAADENFALSCSAGLFYTGNSDGGPYACRDIGAPYDAGVGNRWVQAAIDSSVNASFTDAPIQVSMIWDTSVMSVAQLDPTAAAPTGTPPFAVFYHAQEPQGAVMSNPIRAFAKTCDASLPPCLGSVQKHANGDWTATLRLSQLYDDSVADPLLPGALLGGLQNLLNGLLGTASADLLPPVIMK